MMMLYLSNAVGKGKEEISAPVLLTAPIIAKRWRGCKCLVSSSSRASSPGSGFFSDVKVPEKAVG
jgi:hypothetical protein